MSVVEFLTELSRQDIQVWAEGDRLQIDAPTDTLTRELREQLQQRKSEILEYLRGPAELSFAQQRLWFLDQISPGGAAYVIAEALELRGTVDASVLERALGALVNRHESLRTVFVNVEGRPLQIVSEPGPWTLPVEDLSGQADKDQRLQERLREEAARGFDLARGPVFRARLYRLAADTHVLLLSMHDIVSDGWSMGVLTRELKELYGSLHLGKAATLPALTGQYRSFSRWQRNRLRGEVLEGLLAYWRARLREAPQVLELPSDRPRPPMESFRGAIYSFTLPLEVVGALRNLARREGATLYMTLLAGFTLLLSRYSGQQDLLVGMPVANRNRAEIEDLVGCFVNTLVLRANVTGDPSASEFLSRIRNVCLEAYEHQDLPFEQLVEDIQPQRDASRNPLFQVIFVQQPPALQQLELPGLTLSRVEVDRGAAQVDLTLEVQESKDGLRATFKYATDLFKKQTIVRMASHWRVLLEGMAATPERRLSALPMLTQAERRQAVSGWNQAVSYPRGACLHERFEARVSRTPDAVALVFEGETLSYTELNRRANRLAHRLRDLGVRPDQLVGLRTERGVEMVVGIIGILKAGGAYLPLDPAYPKERAAFMLEDSRASVVVTQRALASDLEGIGVTPVFLDEALPGSDANPEPVASADNLAYVIYTSGSTGKPKGALITHYNVTRLFEATETWYHFDHKDVWTLFHSYAFDFSVWELWGALLYGGRVVVVPHMVSRSPEEFLDLLVRERVTVLNQTPSAFRQLIQADLSRPRSEFALRYVIFGGEALELQSLQPWFERYGDERPLLVNMYGITETTVHVTYRPIRRTDLDSGQGSVIGMPIPDLQVYILDPHGEPAPIGVPGEMYVGGAGVARGYLNRAELSAQRFIPDRFVSSAGSQLYRTGDLARRLENGDIEYLGRIDDQVKIRGYRIELGEIEAAIAQQPGMREVAVLAREDRPGDKRLVAYVVAESPPADLPEQLRVRLRANLPEYMVPVAFVMLEKLPLTPNGKVDRNALPVPEGTDYGAKNYEAPVGDVEITLARILSEMLNVGKVGRHDNFFELGGHSLLAVSMVERMRRAGLHADVRALFTTPTLADLAAVAGGDDGFVEVPPNRIPPACEAITPEMLPLVRLTPTDIERIVRTVPGGAANVQDIYPLVPLQEGIMFHRLIGNRGDPYLTQIRYSFDSRARLEKYLQALRAVIDRNDVLRTAVLWEGLPEPVQVVWRHASLVVEEVSLDLAVGDVAQELASRFDPRHYRLDINQAPLIRVCVARDEAHDRWILLLLSHHLLGDITTVEVMQQEIRAHLLGQVADMPAPLPFRNFVAQTRLGVSWEEEETFFQTMLSDVDEPTAPFGITNVHGDGSGMGVARRTVDTAVARRLRFCARVLGVSAASLCHVAWALVLARISGRADVVFGTVLSGRMRGGVGADRAMGLFINTLPIRIRIGEEGVQESVRLVHALVAQLLCHEHAPLARTQRCSAVAPPLPLFSSLFNFRHSLSTARSSSEALQAWEGIELLGIEDHTNYPLSLDVEDLGDGFALIAEAQLPIDPHRICAYMYNAMDQLVSALESAPATPVCNLDVLPDFERRRLLVEWNDTAMELPPAQCVHDLVAEQAGRTPEAVAVISGGRSVSYRELDRRANQLAHALRRRGVGPDVLVGLCMNRTPELIVALLGILKAGGAYVPLDPDYPEERVAFMLRDCGARVLVTEESLAPSLPPLPATCEVIYLDRADAMLAAENEDTPPSGVERCHLAYAIYTSGSTGRPKAALVTHHGLLNLAVSEKRLYGVGPHSRVLQFASLSFDASLSEIAMALCSGATLYVEGRDAILPGPDLERYLEREKITVLSVTPSALAVLNPAAAPALEQVIVGGETCPAELVARWAGRCRFFNTYGPTEASVVTTYVEYRDGLLPPVIGRPLPNIRVYILDQVHEPVPVGVPGELYIGGIGVARGYLNRPELNAERFLPDPFSNTPGALMYKSGDYGRWRADGEIEFIGRRDDQVKVRGFRIELGEVEAAMMRHPQVKTCAVLAREDTPGERRLVAYLVLRGGDTLTVSALREYLKRSVPDHMVPAAFVMMEALPYTPNGKIDRKALPSPHASEHTWSSGSYVAPRNDLEISLAAAWERVLGVQRVGLTDDFFELGGNSLSVIKLIFEMKQATGFEIDLGEIFRSPTIAGLVGSLGANATKNASVVVPLQPEGSGLPVFCICGINIYKDFAESLGKDQPVYGVYVAEEQAIVNQVISGERPEVSIDRLVEAYYKAITRFQPHGPYRLAGLSFGGILAIELASKMRMNGAEVEVVFLLDAVLPNAIRRNWAKWITWQATDILKGNATRKLRRLLTALPDRWAKRRSQSSIHKKVFDEILLNGQDVLFSRASIEWQKHRSVYDFRVILFRASDRATLEPYFEFDDDYGWGQYLGDRLCIVDAIGGHRGIIEPPNAAELGRKARQFLGSGYGK